MCMTNEHIARVLEEVADVLASDAADPFRARAYRRAADTVRTAPAPLAELYAKGGSGALMELPAVGAGVARAIAELLTTGRLGLLDRRRHAECERAIASVPGIGPVLARRVHQRLGIHTLEDLETAAHDGRLAHVPGFAGRRVRGVSEMLAGRLGRHRRAAVPPRPPLPVEELLDVDREYRDKAARGHLVRIAPRRFNPEHAAWLPVLRTVRGPRQYTALYSNTPRAHALGKTEDWVVLYVDDGRGEREATVVTETEGGLAGRRVVRGREGDCAAHYAAPSDLPATRRAS
jgi:hypothetical protein